MISIVTPVYNAIGFIDDTIAMVQAQDYADWELILVEDGSTDGTREYLTELKNRIESDPDGDSRIRIIIRETTEGAAAGARNAGVDAAGGEYLAFLDADDVWKTDKLRKQLKFMKERQIAFSFTSYEFGDEEAHGTGRFVRVPESITYRQALSRTVIFTSTTMFDLGRIDKSLLRMPYIGSEDTATWWNILKTGVVAFGLDEVLTVYRRPAQSLSSNKLVAIKRFWRLLREIAGLGVIASAYYFCGWAVRATLRRL